MLYSKKMILLLIRLKFLLISILRNPSICGGRVSTALKSDIVDLLTGNQKDYSTKINKILINHYREVPSLLKEASPQFKREIIKLLNYLPR